MSGPHHCMWQNLAKFNLICSQDTEWKPILTITEGHNCAVYFRKLTHNNPNLDLDEVIANAKFGQIPSFCSQDIEHKQNSDDNQGSKHCCKFAKIDP